MSIETTAVHNSTHSDTGTPQAFATSSPFWSIDSAAVGIDHWTSQRKRWTTGNHLTSAMTTSQLTQRRNRGRLWTGGGSRIETRANKEKVYELCVISRRSFARPINLADVVPVMVAGWQKDGTWPQGQVAPTDSF